MAGKPAQEASKASAGSERTSKARESLKNNFKDKGLLLVPAGIEIMKRIVSYMSLAIILLSFPTHGFSQLEGVLDQQQITRLADRIAQAGKKRIAVVDFSDLQGNVTELGRFLAEEVSVALVGAGQGFEVIDRVHLKSILAEHKLALTGIIDPGTARQLGKIAGVDAILTGSITPFGDNIRVSFEVLDTETAMIIAAASGNIARTAAINELLARGIESSQPITQQAAPPVSASYASTEGIYGVAEDSYLRIAVLNVKKSGNKFVTIQFEYQNKTDKEIRIDYKWCDILAVLVDELGNKTEYGDCLRGFVVPPRGKKSRGIGFEFKGGEKLGNDFSLTLFHESNPPGTVSITNLRIRR
jgi:TolB-like protein